MAQASEGEAAGFRVGFADEIGTERGETVAQSYDLKMQSVGQFVRARACCDAGYSWSSPFPEVS